MSEVMKRIKKKHDKLILSPNHTKMKQTTN